MDVQDLARLLKKSSVGHAADYLRSHAAIASLLDQAVGAGGYKTIVSQKPDELREVTRG